MGNATMSVVLDIRNPGVRAELGDIVASMQGFVVRPPNDPDSCDVMIMEVGNNPENDFRRVRSLRDTGRVRGVCLTSSSTNPEMLIAALRAGAREFLPQPIQAAEVKRSLSSLRTRLSRNGTPTEPVATRRGKVLNVIGGKGGVGTTTVAVNTAASLLELPGVESVGLIDMNLLFGDISLFLDIPSDFNWGEVAQNIDRLDSTYLTSIMSKHSSGLSVLPSPTGLEDISSASPAVIDRILDLMRTEFDYVVIDGGQSLDAISLKILQVSDMVLLVSVPSLPCLVNTKRLLDTFGQLGYPIPNRVRVVMNRYHKKSVISIKEAEDGIKKRIAVSIPNDYPTTMAAINQGKTLAGISPKEEIARKFKTFASTLTTTETPKVEKNGIFGWNLAKRRA